MTAAQLAYETASVDFDDRNDLIVQQLPEVYYIAARIRERLPRQVDLEDLVSAGVLGLIDACRKYDGTKNVQFTTFARFRIRGAILDSLRELDWGSRTLRKKSRLIADCTAELKQTLGRQPTEAELATALAITPKQLQKTISEIEGLQIFSQKSTASPKSNSEKNIDLIESAPDRTDNSPFQQFLETERREQLESAIADLTEREQLILSLYYRDELTMKEIATVIGAATSRVSQIHAAALQKLKSSLNHLDPNFRPPTPPITTSAGAAQSRSPARTVLPVGV